MKYITVAEAEAATAELNGRIQALPQELQDAILWLTDGFQVPTIVQITERRPHRGCPIREEMRFNPCYRPPTALQLNTEIRAKFARKYYSTVTFDCFTGNDSGFLMDPKYALHFPFKWLQSLSTAHRGMIIHLQLTEIVIRFDRNRHYWFPRYLVDKIKEHLAKIGDGDEDRIEVAMACMEGKNGRTKRCDSRGYILLGSS